MKAYLKNEPDNLSMAVLYSLERSLNWWQTFLSNISSVIILSWTETTLVNFFSRRREASVYTVQASNILENDSSF